MIDYLVYYMLPGRDDFSRMLVVVESAQAAVDEVRKYDSDAVIFQVFACVGDWS